MAEPKLVDLATIQRAARVATQLSPTARGAISVSRKASDGRYRLHPAFPARTRGGLVRQGIAVPGEPAYLLTDFGVLVRQAVVKGVNEFLAEHTPGKCPMHGDDHTVEINDMLTCRECRLCSFPEIEHGQAYCGRCGEPMVCDECGERWGASA
jgi:hypothetical protein